MDRQHAMRVLVFSPLWFWFAVVLVQRLSEGPVQNTRLCDAGTPEDKHLPGDDEKEKSFIKKSDELFSTQRWVRKKTQLLGYKLVLFNPLLGQM